MKKTLILLLFLIISLNVLAGAFFSIKILEFIFKPLIMVWIGGYFFINACDIDKKIIQMALVAFVFSWIGDILLMFGERDFLFFMSGLVSFLGAQIAYIFLFLRTINLSGKKPFLKKNPLVLMAYIAYGLILFMLLYNGLDEVLRVAVFIYMVALLGMSAMALNRFGNGHPVSFTYVFVGSLFFVLSDSLLAVNAFLIPIPYKGVLIMLTYIIAQYLIMQGLLKQYK